MPAVVTRHGRRDQRDGYVHPGARLRIRNRHLGRAAHLVAIRKHQSIAAIPVAGSAVDHAPGSYELGIRLERRAVRDSDIAVECHAEHAAARPVAGRRRRRRGGRRYSRVEVCVEDQRAEPAKQYIVGRRVLGMILEARALEPLHHIGSAILKYLVLRLGERQSEQRQALFGRNSAHAGEVQAEAAIGGQEIAADAMAGLRGVDTAGSRGDEGVGLRERVPVAALLL